jgi:glycosyltransferase involved in cell wall biosynthesis
MSLFKNGPQAFDQFSAKTIFPVSISHQPFTCFALLTKKRLTSIPLIYVFHSPNHEEYLLTNEIKNGCWRFVQAWTRKIIEGYCLKKSEIILVLSQYMKQKIIDIHGIADEKVMVNPGGVDLDRFLPVENRTQLKGKLQLPLGKVHLLTVRNLEPRMGLDNLLKAIALLKEKTSNVHLVIGGEGPERNNLVSLIHRYELGHNVTMAGFIPAEQLPKYYGAADFFVLPTRELEGFGLVTPESMACGTPVLGTPVGGTREILSGFDSQFLFKDATPEAMAEGVAWAMDNWLNDEERYAWLRGRCREYAEKNYSWQRHVDQLKSIIDELVAVKGELN